MTITIALETEVKLREKAYREGRDVDTLADDLLARVLEDEKREQTESTAAIQAGLNAGKAGREKPLNQYIIEQRKKYGWPETWPSAAVISESVPGEAITVE